MPELAKHFETLEITPDLFLIDWMLTLFSKVLPLELASRVWDNFLLDGEVFAMRVSLALLQYREPLLVNQSYQRIVRVLRGSRHDEETPEVEAEKLFRLVEGVEVDRDEYYGDLKMQKWSYQKSKILGSVFK